MRTAKGLSSKTTQLDWKSCADTHKINLPRDQEGYDGFEYTDEKLSTRRIQWCVDPSSIIAIWEVSSQKYLKNKNEAWLSTPMDAPRRELFIRVFKSTASLSFCGKWIFSVFIADCQSSCTGIEFLDFFEEVKLVCVCLIVKFSCVQGITMQYETTVV